MAEIKLKDMDGRGGGEFIHIKGRDKDLIIKHHAANQTILIGLKIHAVQKVLGFMLNKSGAV